MSCASATRTNQPWNSASFEEAPRRAKGQRHTKARNLSTRLCQGQLASYPRSDDSSSITTSKTIKPINHLVEGHFHWAALGLESPGVGSGGEVHPISRGLHEGLTSLLMLFRTPTLLLCNRCPPFSVLLPKLLQLGPEIWDIRHCDVRHCEEPNQEANRQLGVSTRRIEEIEDLDHTPPVVNHSCVDHNHETYSGRNQELQQLVPLGSVTTAAVELNKLSNASSQLETHDELAATHQCQRLQGCRACRQRCAGWQP